MASSEFDFWHMARALELAHQGEGLVEPNPMVGCTIVAGDQVVGEGWHQRFGGPHAEVEALRAAGNRADGATLYVTLEPCCHHGKTPPCTQAILQAGIRRVVVAMRDPFHAVAGGGIAELERAGIEVSLGLLAEEARGVNAPYLKLVETGRPWIIAKWAMTLDGKIATRSGASRWISGEESRAVAHRLRGRVDAILVGARTAQRDDPLLMARPVGPRQATRVVVDTQAALDSASQLACTARQVPVLVAVGSEAPHGQQERLRSLGCEVFVCPGNDRPTRLDALLQEFGRRRFTNVLVEGGGELLGSLADAGQIDAAHVFVSTKILGGAAAPSPVGGQGVNLVAEAAALEGVRIETLGSDLYLRGRVSHARRSL